MRNIVPLLLLALPLLAQNQDSVYSIGGSVVNSRTGEVVKNALVSVVRISDGGLDSTETTPRIQKRCVRTYRLESLFGLWLTRLAVNAFLY